MWHHHHHGVWGHPHYYGGYWGPGWGWGWGWGGAPLIEGMVIGGLAASAANSGRSDDYAAYQARADADRATAAANQAAIAANAAAAAANANANAKNQDDDGRIVTLVVPQGISPSTGGPVRIRVEGEEYQVTVPPGFSVGSYVKVRIPTKDVVHAVPLASAAGGGSSSAPMPSAPPPPMPMAPPAYGAPPPPPMPMPGYGTPGGVDATRTFVRVAKDHIVDERSPTFAAHGIISVPEGETLELVGGSLDNGLPSPYEDYILVRTSSGRVGKVSRWCVSRLASSTPPPALHAPSESSSSSS